ncbi:PP2C family protein-serine/threonine phosphatase [Streptomyces sp. NPDC007070]|uniref:PP2C family protein-serine/threonine phosphatase n=1 Tax=Streptomyces sp. NPDC007070 TaxID=3154312 RepID=UPI0033CD8073
MVGVSDGRGPGQPPPAARDAAGRPLLSLALAAMLDEVHAHSGAVYLLAPDQPVLEMAVMAGMPRDFAAPWERVGLSAPIPVAQALRERRLIWVSGEEEMVRRHPRIAVVLPYPFALTALPLATRDAAFGAVFVGRPRTAVRAFTTVGQEPQEVMRSTNRLLMDLGVELFASCLYLRLDPADGSAVMSRAGHPPLLRRPDGRVRVLDLAGGPLLGIDPAATYPTTRVGLAPGSVLVLYTDGLVESPDVDIEDALAELGQRLGEAGRTPLDELADCLVRHSAAARERADDVALSLLRARGDG